MTRNAFAVRGALGATLAGPGGLYNLGNAIGFAAGLFAAVANPRSSNELPAGPWNAVFFYMAGSSGALLMTTATMGFFVSGQYYSKAYAPDVTPRGGIDMIRSGDILSGIGAVALASGLLWFGNPYLALLSGSLHAGGKFCSAWLSTRREGGAPSSSVDLCRYAVLLSRLPGSAVALIELVTTPSSDARGIVLPATILTCYGLWCVADCQLLIRSRALPRLYHRRRPR